MWWLAINMHRGLPYAMISHPGNVDNYVLEFAKLLFVV